MKTNKTSSQLHTLEEYFVGGVQLDKQVTSKIAELLGRSQPKQENICVDKGGVIVVTEGKLNINKLVTKALAI